MSNATWKKIVLGMAALSVLAIGGCVALVGHWLNSLPDLCAEATINVTPSPSGKLKAFVRQRDCGATTRPNHDVSIVPASTKIAEEPPVGGKGSGSLIRLKWLSERLLEIQYSERAEIDNTEKSIQGVNIVYRTFR